jgi:hypothetical protein
MTWKTTRHQVEQAGAVIMQAISPTPAVTLLYARHTDGTLIEYVQWPSEMLN